tara:strand:+ start:794 stop:1180 length:387 start_codon:yes stop_codon:yes gene_type:complete
MTINQLFTSRPPQEKVLTVIEFFNLNGFHDTKSFTKKDLSIFETVKKINENISLLEEWYLPCKAKIYLTDLNEKKSITILRQLLKLYKYNLKSTEKYIQGDKMIEYNIYCNFKKDEQKPEEKCVISFD